MVFLVYGPAVENTLQHLATKTKYNTSFPQFGEEWTVNLTGDWRKTEIQISVKERVINISTNHNAIEIRNLLNNKNSTPNPILFRNAPFFHKFKKDSLFIFGPKW